MATTTNYGWTTPDDTALVKDGASAIRTLGTSVDTTTKNLNPSTTLGDIEYRSSTANTNTRLGIGSTGQVLTVAAGVPSWAASSGMTLLSTTTLSGTTTTISSISQSYTDLQIYFYGLNISADDYPEVQPNGSTTITDGIFAVSSSVATSASSVIYIFSGNAQLDAGNTTNGGIITIFNYADTNGNKPFNLNSGMQDSAAARKAVSGSGLIRTTSGISSLVFKAGGVKTFSAGTVLVYGVK